MDREQANELIADHKVRMDKLYEEQRRRALRGEVQIGVMLFAVLITCAAVIWRLLSGVCS